METPVALIRPDPDGPYPDGLRTLSVVGDQTARGGAVSGWAQPANGMSTANSTYSDTPLPQAPRRA
ncbi:MAG: hypothetical protein WKH64_15115 [Chloroflexia bacterium]